MTSADRLIGNANSMTGSPVGIGGNTMPFGYMQPPMAPGGSSSSSITIGQNPMLNPIGPNNQIMSAIQRRRNGGPINRMQLYRVGEQNKPEIYLPEGGQPEVIGQNGEEVRSFPKDGEVIPHEQAKKMVPSIIARYRGGPVSGSFNDGSMGDGWQGPRSESGAARINAHTGLAKTADDFYAERDAKMGNPLDRLYWGDRNRGGGMLERARQAAFNPTSPSPALPSAFAEDAKRSSSIFPDASAGGKPPVFLNPNTSVPEDPRVKQVQDAASESKYIGQGERKDYSKVNGGQHLIDGLPHDIYWQQYANDKGEAVSTGGKTFSPNNRQNAPGYDPKAFNKWQSQLHAANAARSTAPSAPAMQQPIIKQREGLIAAARNRAQEASKPYIEGEGLPGGDYFKEVKPTDDETPPPTPKPAPDAGVKFKPTSSIADLKRSDLYDAPQGSAIERARAASDRRNQAETFNRGQRSENNVSSWEGQKSKVFSLIAQNPNLMNLLTLDEFDPTYRTEFTKLGLNPQEIAFTDPYGQKFTNADLIREIKKDPRLLQMLEGRS